MKANEAPEKIYIDNPNRDFWYHTKNSNSIEYTRTDAFIDKAIDYITNNMRCDGYTMQTKATFIRGFKNYMKGE